MSQKNSFINSSRGFESTKETPQIFTEIKMEIKRKRRKNEEEKEEEGGRERNLM